MKSVYSPEKLAIEIQKCGEFQIPYNSWSSDGQPLPTTTAKTRYVQSLPKGLYECSCKDRHHMIAPRTISESIGEEDGDTVIRAEFDFDVHIYGHYYKEIFFNAKETFLVCCKNNVVGLVSLKVKGAFGGNYERAKFELISNKDTLDSLIEYQRSQRLKGEFVYYKPLDSWV